MHSLESLDKVIIVFTTLHWNLSIMETIEATKIAHYMEASLIQRLNNMVKYYHRMRTGVLYRWVPLYRHHDRHCVQMEMK